MILGFKAVRESSIFKKEVSICLGAPSNMDKYLNLFKGYTGGVIRNSVMGVYRVPQIICGWWFAWPFPFLLLRLGFLSALTLQNLKSSLCLSCGSFHHKWRLCLCLKGAASGSDSVFSLGWGETSGRITSYLHFIYFNSIV